MDPDQTAPIGAVCSGSRLFASILDSSVMLGNYLQQTTSADNIFRCIFFLGTLRHNMLYPLMFLNQFSCIDSLPLGNLYAFFLVCWFFFKINFFEKFFKVWIQIGPNVLLGLIWVPAVCEGYQQTTLVGKGLNHLGLDTRNLTLLAPGMKRVLRKSTWVSTEYWLFWKYLSKYWVHIL